MPEELPEQYKDTQRGDRSSLIYCEIVGRGFTRTAQF